MYSHEQLINAVRAAGRDGKTFSVKDVRTQLGFETRDKKELSRFRRRLRAFEKEVGEQLEKVGNNSYRLAPGAFAEAQKHDARDPASGVFETLQTEAQPQPVQPVQPEIAAPLPPSAATITASEPALAAAPSLAVVASAPQPAAEQLTEAQHASAEESVAARIAVEQPALDAERTHAVAPHPAAAARAVAATVAEHSATNGAAKQTAFSAQREATAAARSEYVPPPSAAVAGPAQRAGHAVNRVQRAKQLATTLLSGALAASAAVSGKVRQRSHNLREQLWSCIQAVPTKQHAIARLRGWAEGLRPLSGQVRNQLNALRHRVRRA